MLVSQYTYLLENKGINHVVRKLDGKEFDLNTLYLKDPNGTLTNLVVNNYLYQKAEVGKSYKIKVWLDNNGKLTVNDIELQK